MELNKIELKKISHDFNTVSSRIMRAKVDEYIYILAKFLSFIDENEILLTYVMSGNTGEFDAAKFLQVVNSGDNSVFDFGPSSEEETYQIYAVLKHIAEKKLDVSLCMRLQYASIGNNRNAIVKEFNNRVVLVLIQSIEGYLTKLGYDMGMDDRIYYNVNGGQVNIANGQATINAIQNNRMPSDEIEKMAKAILDNVHLANKESAETIVDSVNMIKEELLKPQPKRGIISNGIKLLAPFVTVANGIPILMSNINTFIQYALHYIQDFV